MDVAEPLDVGEDLVGAGPADGAGGLEGVADQHDAGAAIAGVGIEIDGADLDVAGNGERAGDALQPRQRRMSASRPARGETRAARDRRTRDRRTDWRASRAPIGNSVR